MSQWISTKSGQKGADTQKSIIVHKRDSQPVLPTFEAKKAKDQSTGLKQSLI